MAKHPPFSFEVGPETLIMLAWCSTLDLKALLEKDQRARPWKYDAYPSFPRQDRRLNLPANVFEEPIVEALAGLGDDPYGPALRSLVDYRLLFVDMEEVVNTMSLEGLVEPRHAIFSSDEPYEGYTIRKQREQGPANETDAFWQSIAQSEELQRRLHRLSETWHTRVCQGACTLQAFFLAYPRLSGACQKAPFFVRALLSMSLERVNWHAIAANLLNVEPPLCTCSRSNNDDAAAQIALFEERLTVTGHDLRQVSELLPEPQREVALFLSDCCEKAVHLPSSS